MPIFEHIKICLPCSTERTSTSQKELEPSVMCTTFIVRCICGHEFHRNVMKCSQAIRSQLELADSNIVDDSGTIRSGCVCEIDPPKEYLKPDICEQCKNEGLIGDYLSSNPSVKFEIIKEWHAQKRALKASQVGVDKETDEDQSMTEESGSVVASSVYSAAGSRPRTPAPEIQPLDIRILLKLDYDGDGGELTTLSPISICIATPETGQSEFDVQDNNLDPVFSHSQNFDEMHHLKNRSTALRTKLDDLVAANKRREALEAKD